MVEDLIIVPRGLGSFAADDFMCRYLAVGHWRSMDVLTRCWDRVGLGGDYTRILRPWIYIPRITALIPLSNLQDTSAPKFNSHIQIHSTSPSLLSTVPKSGIPILPRKPDGGPCRHGNTLTDTSKHAVPCAKIASQGTDDTIQVS